MKYLLLIYMNENALSDTERKHCYGDLPNSPRNFIVKNHLW